MRVGALVVASFAVAVGVARGAPPKTLEKLCGLPAVKGAVVHFRAGKTQLTGAVAGPAHGRVGIVLVNTLDGNICAWVSPSGAPKLINALVADGDQVLMFNYPTSFDRLDEDVAAAATVLRGRGAREIVLVGGSMGGAVSIIAARELEPAPAAVVGLSATGVSPPFTTSEAAAAAARLKVPLLLVVARNDVLFDVKQLYKASAAKDKQLLVVPGTAHAYFETDPAGPKVQATVLAFIRRHTRR